MELTEFQTKLKELCNKTTMFYAWLPLVYDSDRKGLIFIDEEGHFNLLDNESYNWIKLHFNLRDIIAVKYDVTFEDEEAEYIDQSRIYILFKNKERIVINEMTYGTLNNFVFFYINKELENDDTVESLNRIKNNQIEGYKVKIMFDTDENGHFYD